MRSATTSSMFFVAVPGGRWWVVLGRVCVGVFVYVCI